MKNLVAEIDDPVDFGGVNVAFMKSSYELSRQVNTFMSELKPKLLFFDTGVHLR